MLFIALFWPPQEIKAATPSTIPITFRPRGFIAESRSWGHLSASINISYLNDILEQAKNSVNESFYSADWNRNPKHEAKMKVYSGSIYNSLRIPSRLMDLVDLTFFNEQPMLVPPHISFNYPLGSRKPDYSLPTEREKRQALEIIGSLSIGLSIYNLVQVKELQNRVDTLENENAHIVAVLENDHLILNALSQAVVTLNKSMIVYADELTKIQDQVHFLNVHTLIQNEVNILSQEFGLIFDGLVELAHGKLSPNLIDKSKITSAFRTLEQRAKEKNYNLLHPEVSSIFKSQISYVADPKTKIINVIIHIPLFKNSRMAVYEHISTPILFNNSMNAPLMFVSSPSGPFLAIDELNPKKGAEISATQLAGCNVEVSALGSIFLCQNSLIVSNNVEFSCLGTLFSGNYDEKLLTSLCDVKLRDVSEYWTQVDSNNFMLYSKEPTKLTKICPTSTPGKLQSNISMVQHLQILTVEPGCTAFTNLYTLYGATEITLDSNFIYLPQMVNFEHPTFDQSNLATIYKELSTLNLPKEISFRELELFEKTKTWRRHSLSIGGALTVVALMLGLAIVAYLAWTYWKFRRASTRLVSNPAPAAAQDNIELLAR